MQLTDFKIIQIPIPEEPGIHEAILCSRSVVVAFHAAKAVSIRRQVNSCVEVSLRFSVNVNINFPSYLSAFKIALTIFPPNSVGENQQ